MKKTNNAALKAAAKLTYDSFEDFPVDLWQWPNFTPAELASKGDGKLKINVKALNKLQALRDALGKPLFLTSAYRSPEHNHRVGGATNSQHMLAKAFDVQMSNHDPVVFEATARKVGFTGFGYYPDHGFMHIDTGRERFWGNKWPVAKPVAENEPYSDTLPDTVPDNRGPLSKRRRMERAKAVKQNEPA